MRYRKPIANSTKSRATEQLGSICVDLSCPKSIHSFMGKKNVMIVKGDFTRYSWVYFLERKFKSADAFRRCLADARAGDVPSDVDRVMNISGLHQRKESRGKRCCRESSRYHLNAALAAHAQVPILFPHIELPPSETRLAQVVRWVLKP